MALSDLFGADAVAPNRPIRTAPTQQRSEARLSGLLDAAASVVDEVGFDRITTAMVAERAGASIGTVYRYYPDRVAVLQALHERAVLRFQQRIVEEVELSEPASWSEAVDCAVTAFVGTYRTEPGFRIMHFADHERTPLGAGAQLSSAAFADRLATMFGEHFGLPSGPDYGFRLEVALKMADALLSRAFFTDPLGDDRFIVECRRVLRGYLVEFYGPTHDVPALRTS